MSPLHMMPLGASDVPHVLSVLPLRLKAFQKLHPRGRLARRKGINPTKPILFIEPQE